MKKYYLKKTYFKDDQNNINELISIVAYDTNKTLHHDIVVSSLRIFENSSYILENEVKELLNINQEVRVKFELSKEDVTDLVGKYQEENLHMIDTSGFIRSVS